MASVQIIIPAYNAERFISDTIESALNQSMPGIEIIVLDNASTDRTSDIVRGFASRGVKYVVNESNIGGINNHNRGIELATSDYFKLLSADDVLLPDVIARQAAALDADPRLGLVSCNYIETDSQLRLRREVKFLAGHLEGRSAVEQCAKKAANMLGAPSQTLVRRSSVGTAKYDPELKWLADLDFACQILQRWDYRNIDAVGVYYRRHDTNDSIVGCTPTVRLRDDLRFARNYHGGLSARARIVYRAAKYMISFHGNLRDRSGKR